MGQSGEKMLAQGSVFQQRYEILSLLGRGGFGEVYKARQPTTGQLVALKLMRVPERGGPDRAQIRARRFLRETKLCAQLHHPNIVQLLDSGSTDDGQLYAAFAFVPGHNLAEVIALQGAIEPQQAKHLMLQVLDALCCAHKQSVVHRDIKPGNIMVTATGARLNALVLDFGMGAILDEDSEDAEYKSRNRPVTRLTASEEILGTVGYAAPEQLRGQPPVPASDLFSWALVLIECLTGSPVYAGNSMAEIMHAQLSAEPVAVPEALLHHPLGDVLRHVTNKNAEERSVGASELLRAFEACELRGLTTEAVVSGTPFAGAMIHSQVLSLLDSAPSSDGAAASERRQVTALCCGLQERDRGAQGPDGSRRRLDAGALEELDAHLRELMEQYIRVAHEHGGYVVSALGSQLLVYFGYPRAKEDDAPRAARAALAMTALMQSSSADARGLDLHLAIHAGLVVTASGHSGFEQPPMVGVTPRRAAGLMTAAPAGTIAVSVEARELLRATFGFRAAGEGDANAPEPMHFLLGELSQAESFSTLDNRTSLVGRDQEMELLVERWRRARQGVGQCCLLTGEAGIGKSRLARELRVRLADQDCVFIECRCAPHSQNSVLYPFIDLLERLIGRIATKDGAAGEQASRLEKLETLLSEHVVELAETIPLLAPLLSIPLDERYAPPDVSAPRRKELRLEALLSLLSSFADEQPLFLLVEDLHWADPTTTELLTQVVREVPSVAMFALFTARPEFFPPFPATGMLQLHLNRLEPTQIKAMIGEIAPEKPVSEGVVERVVKRTDGIPLFVEELMRMMLEAEMIVLSEHGYELTGTLSDAAIPSTLRALLTARLDRFEQPKETAQLLATIGREIDVVLLTAVSPLDPERVQADLDRLVTAGLIYRRRSRRTRLYAFKHALIRDTAYELLPEGQRRAIHARIAATIEQQFLSIVNKQPELLAYHHAAADQKEQAIAYTKIAANVALQSSSYLEATAHANLMIDWSKALEPQARIDSELAAMGVLTQAMMATRGWADPSVIEVVERSRALLDQLGHDSEHRVPTLWSLFTYHHAASERALARRTAEELVEVGKRTGDEGLQISAELMLGFTYHVDGRYADARDILTQAIERGLQHFDLAQRREHAIKFGGDTLVQGRAVLALIAWLYGETEGALELAKESEAWAREVNHVPTLALTLIYLAVLYQHEGDRETVAMMMQEVFMLSQQHGLLAEPAYATMLFDWANGTVESTPMILSQLQQMGCKIGLSYYSSLQADTEAAEGRVDEAIKRIDLALGMCQDNHEYYYEAELHRRRAAYGLLKAPGGDEAIKSSLEAAAQAARQRYIPRVEALALSDLLRIFGADALKQERLSELVAAHPALATCAGVGAV